MEALARKTEKGRIDEVLVLASGRGDILLAIENWYAKVSSK